MAASLLVTACYRDARTDRYPGYDSRQSQVFEAYTTDGDYVTVQQDRRTGNMIIVQPEQLRGEQVAVVNRDDRGHMLVTREVQSRRHYRDGSGGDDGRGRDDHRRDAPPDQRR